MGCHTHIIHTHEASPPIYSVLETTSSDVVGDDYKLPSHIRTLPISPFTWYPEGSTLVLPIGLDGVMGRFVWQNSCLLFKPDDFDGFVTPIFWVNSIKDYQINDNQEFLILHNDKIIHLNHEYHIESLIEPKQNPRTKRIIQRGQDKCLMDKVIYLGIKVVD